MASLRKIRQSARETLSRLRTTNEEFKATRIRAAAFNHAYNEAPWQFTRNGLLQEIDPGTWDHLQQMQGWEQMFSLGGEAVGTDEQDRLRQVTQSRYAYRTNAYIKRMVQMWTDFAFGLRVEILIDDDKAQEVWNECWTSRDNRAIFGPRNLSKNSNILLVDGEIFYTAFGDVVTGLVKWRRVATEEITAVVTEPGDTDVNVLYRRTSTKGTVTKTRYYKDTAAEDKAIADAQGKIKWDSAILKAEDENTATDVYMMHVPFNTLTKRGRPMTSTSIPWARADEEFLLNRVTLSRAVATFFEDIETKGGSRGIGAVRTYMQSALNYSNYSETNPPPPVGSPLVHNEAVSRKRMPLSTGASDASTDSMILTSMVGLGMGVPPHWLGRPDAMQNRAVARELLLPTMRQWRRYQLFWRSVFEDIVRFTLKMRSEYPAGNGLTFADKLNIDVTLDSPIDAEFKDVIEGVVDVFDRGLLDAKLLTRIIARLPEFGLTDIDEIVSAMYPETEQAETLQTLKDLLGEGSVAESLEVIKEILGE